MSELLKNAMIDAEALKKVAQSNAESLLLERFSAQIKEAVDQILEAPATDEGDDEDLTSNTPGGMDPIGMEGGDDDMGLGGTSGTEIGRASCRERVYSIV
jgi:hypothetical protein